MNDHEQRPAEDVMALERLVSKAGRQLRADTLGAVIANEPLRARWQSFDACLLRQCILQSKCGIAFDNAAFEHFRQPEHAPLLRLGVTVYNACAKALFGQPSHDYPAFLRLSQIYLSARMAQQCSR